MYLKEIVLEGFKSYAQKTVVKPFDKHFNAITGLNGSGKSNILDSLIFLLGIVGYKDLRASDSKDLIYKQGSAGITTATVTGVFDNSDPNRSPNGYQHCKSIKVSRSILATGQSKYSINDTKCTQTQVQEMFQSVQLNVLNPHFIIMQGRIAKVCNMKTGELLRLIEEATGTSMYENKRDSALKNMEKRETTLKQAAEMMQVINQKKEELAQKVKKHEQFRLLTPLIDSLKRQRVAIQYLDKKRELDKCKEDKERFENEHTRCEIALQQGAVETERLKAECEQIRQEQEESIEGKTAKAEFDEAKKKEQEAKVILDRLRGERKNNIESEVKLGKEIEQDAKLMDLQQKQLDQQQQQYQDAMETEVSAKDYVDTLAESIGATGSGTAIGNGGFEERKQQEEHAAREAETQIHLANAALGGLHDDLNEEHRRQGNDKAQHEQLGALLDKLNHDAASLEDRLTASAREYCAITSVVLAGRSVDSVRPDELDRTRDYSFENATTILGQQRQAIRGAIQNLHQQITQVNSNANNPLSKPEWFGVMRQISLFDTLNKNGVNARDLHGPVLNLFSITDPQEWGLALEVTGGNKLFNIVVSSYESGSTLLKNNQNSNSTIQLLALDRIRVNFNHNQIQQIRNRYGDRVVLARDVVQPRPHAPQQFNLALDSIFGGTFLCPDSTVARDISNSGVRAITVQGDVFEPSGSMSGGSLGGMNWLREYARASRLGDKASEFQQQVNALENFDHKLNQLFGDLQTLRNMKQEIIHKTERQKRSGFQRSLDNIQRIEGEIAAKQTQIAALESKMAKSRAAAKEYADKIKGMSGSDGERKKQEMKKELDVKKKELAKLSAVTKDLKIQMEELEDELNVLGERHRERENELVAQKRATEKTNKDFDQCQLNHQSAVDHANRAGKKWDEIVKKNEFVADSLKRLEADIFKGEQIRRANEQHLVSFKQEIKNAIEKFSAATTTITEILKKDPWIKNDEDRFNVPGSEYDFRERTEEDIQEEYRKARERLAALKRFDDPLCVEQYEQLEKDFKDKTAKFKDVRTDRDAIKKSIEILDLKKTETVENTYKVVDRYFGQIFSILLPGAQSRLKPHRNADGALIGCEMQVAFNNKWKESLSELSGGQRSLLALSLILALLRCKPAPLYILDEVDAALDASHTQNIGKTIKEHFEQSQFIIVSLKEGMFENANVLIRTQLGPNGSMLTVNRRTAD